MSAKGSGTAGLVEQALLRLGRCTVSQLVAAVGRYVPVTAAVALGRRKWRTNHPCGGSPPGPAKLAEIGRRERVSQALNLLLRRGRAERVGPATYAPPAPKLFKPGQAG